MLMTINSQVRHGAAARHSQCLGDGEQRPEASIGGFGMPSMAMH